MLLFVRADPSVCCYEEGLFLCPRKHVLSMKFMLLCLQTWELTAVCEI